MSAKGLLPTFLVIGAPKSGTTSLFEYLRSHPDIYMPPRKEVNFFIKPDCLDNVDWYRNEFSDAGSASVIGEASPRYTMYPQFEEVPARIAKVIPDVRLIYAVRHPIERMQSNWHHDLVLGNQLPRIETALIRHPQFFETSRYALQIEQYLEHFARDQLLVITAEALRNNRDETIGTVLRFIGVADDVPLHDTRTESNRTADMHLRRALVRRIPRRVYRSTAEHLPIRLRRALGPIIRRPTRAEDAQIPDELRQLLETKLADDVRRLRAYLGDDFDGWGIA